VERVVVEQFGEAEGDVVAEGVAVVFAEVVDVDDRDVPEIDQHDFYFVEVVQDEHVVVDLLAPRSTPSYVSSSYFDSEGWCR
jgi:hypothetical protein